ncbi:MAG TPA: hypothetical protein VFD95_08340 [Usitatibacter sp.]|jgi:hypothetical protein|nr:hypothetical protein [Usitatibacter sp.]
MRETAVIGVIGSSSIRKCMECQAAAGGEGFTCTGFGVGCFLPRAAKPAANEERLEQMQPRFIFRKKA